MKKRVLVALLCLTLVSCFVACDMEFGGLVGELFSQGVGDYVPSDDFIPGPSIEETWIETDVLIGEQPTIEPPANVYPGETVTILGSSYSDLGLRNDSSELVNELSYMRNETVEETLNVSINTLYCSWMEFASVVGATVQSGNHDYDILMANIANVGAVLTFDGYLVNLNTLAYVDMSSAAWDDGVNEGFAIGSYLPMATGALVPTSDMNTAMLAFNTQMADEMGVNLYDYVTCGGWTLEKMYSFVNESYADLNGNGMADYGDFFGLTLEGDRAYAFACGADAMLIGKDAQNLPVINDNALNRMIEAYEGLVAVSENRGCLYLPTHSFTNTDKQQPQRVFEECNALLYGTTVNNAQYMHGEGVEFGVLPYPKLNEQQESYQSFMNTAASAVMVPACARDYDLSGYVIQGLAQTSYGLYRDRLSDKICRCAQDAEMMKLIWETKTLDFGSNYLIGEINFKVQYLPNLLDQSGTVVSWLAQNQKLIEQALAKLSAIGENLG